MGPPGLLGTKRCMFIMACYTELLSSKFSLLGAEGKMISNLSVFGFKGSTGLLNLSASA